MASACAESWARKVRSIPLSLISAHLTLICPSILPACTRTSCHARPTEKIKAAKAWSIWEGRISKLVQDPLENMKHGDEMFALAFARIENHYFTNKGFFPR